MDCDWSPPESLELPLPILSAVQRGILGGTFDPPHLAHLVAAEGAYRQLGLDVVSLLPAGDPWQKADRNVTPAKHRLGMTRAAVEGVDYFEVDDREIHRVGPTYTIDTLESYPDDESLFLVLGSDSAVGLPSWHRWEEVLDRATLCVMERAGVARAEVEAAIGQVQWLDIPPLGIAGTRLRAMASKGQSLRFLIPDPVLLYIEEHQIYD